MRISVVTVSKADIVKKEEKDGTDGQTDGQTDAQTVE